MDKELTIQEVAEQTGLTTYALRYYERAGLLRSISRASSGHRRYTTTDIGWIQLLQRLRKTGMSIRQMQVFTELHRIEPQPVDEQLAFLEAHKKEVEQHIEEWQEHLRVLDAKIEHKKKRLAELQQESEQLMLKKA